MAQPLKKAQVKLEPSLGGLARGRLAGLRPAARQPGVIAAGMKVQDQALAADTRFDFVFDFFRSDEHPAEIARRATALAPPHAPRDCAAQGGYR